jgi:hypothetical protein
MPASVVRSLLAFPLVTLVACGACGGAPAPDRSPQGNRTAKEVEYIRLHQDRIRAKLRDPSAAEFRNARVYYAVAPTVCGEVNARNGFGGASGFQRFVSAGDIQVIEEQMAPGEMDKTWAQVCR